MERIDFGMRSKAISIQRANCADNVMGRAILIDPNPAVKHIAWLTANKQDGTEIKRGVEVDQTQAIALKTIPRTTYFFLIARLNTDLRGNVVGDDITVEYLQLSSNVYEEFCDSAKELKDFSHITLTKKVRKPGDTYGYIKPSASQQDIPKSVVDKVNMMRNQEGFVAAMWQMVDMDSSMTLEGWKELLKANNIEASIPALPSDNSSQRQIQSNQRIQNPQLAAPQSNPAADVTAPQNDFGFNGGNDFGSDGNDFGTDNDFE